MATIVTRAGKGAKLTWNEADANFNNLNSDKIENSDIGTAVQAYSANLDEYAAVNPTAAGLALLDDATASDQLTTLGALGVAGGNMTGGINSARGNITQHATTMDFFATTSPDILDGTGSAVTITACVNAPQAGATRKFYPIVATVLTHGATFDCVGNTNLTAAAGDCWIIEAKTTSTYRVSAVKEDGKAVVGGNEIKPITASVGASALTISAGALTLDFRSDTLSSGTISTVSGDPADLVIPSGAKMGAVSGQQSRIAVLALNNAGTIELAATNVGGAGSAKDLSETGLISTEATTVGCTFTGAIAVTTGILTLTTGLTGSLTIGQQLTGTNVTSGTVVLSLLTGSLGANGSTYQTNQFTAAASTTITGAPGVGVYSTTARSNLPYRVLGYVESTQATAGTWATTPSTVQGAGGNAVTAMSSLGYGQTWQDMTASRALSTTYYNTTGRPIGISIYSATAAAEGLIFAVNGVTVADNYASASNAIAQITSIVPPGANYSLTVHSGTFSKWSELR